MTRDARARARSATARYETPAQRVEIGAGVVDGVGGIIFGLGGRVVGVLAGDRVWRGPLGERVRRSLGSLDRVVCTEIEPHTPLPAAVRLGRRFADAGVDVILALGGGSAGDLGKATAAVMAARGDDGRVDMSRLFARVRADGTVSDPVVGGRPVPLVVVPTTLSGAELTPGAGVTENGMKRVLWDQALSARAVLYETSDDNDLPAGIVATTSMNAVAHAVEAMYSTAGNAISDGLALAGLDALAAGMLRYLAARDRGEDAKAELFTGAVLASRALCTARVCLHHAVCHVLGAHHGVAHGDANAVMLSYVVDFNEAGAARPLARCAAVIRGAAERVLGTPLTAASPGAVLREFQHRVGAPVTLAEIGLPAVDVEGVVAGLREERGVALNPVPVTDDDVRRLVAAAVHGVA
ncbi:iron-containing alcohol dehydrogenase family protein [Actinomadura darangshiensis]|uniref:iron-containing alcohol dehydrogenase family protein n=1 Tax=Actinomadura darangshiensis TaxID=705336 RepID=UPI00140DA502|nr:iron-containing alcohol dehydrogenase [Actinomadura darangshiensis]